MTQGIYIAGTEARNGKSVVVLAMMEHLIGHGRKVGFFRPVIRNEDDRDNLIHLVQNRYALEFSYEAMHGCTYEVARKLIATGKMNSLYSMILEKFCHLKSDSICTLYISTF